MNQPMIGQPQPRRTHPVIRVGLTERHGMASEISQFPPEGVEYSFLEPHFPVLNILRSPIKGYMLKYQIEDNDLIEAIICPVRTRSRWIYSCETLTAATAFNLLGIPLPRAVRISMITRMLAKNNCKKVIFWSQAGKKSLQSYAGIDDENLLRKTTVVYPAVRKVADDLIRYNENRVNILFSGDFFRKGGVNVVDAFLRAQEQYPSIKLRLCCDEKIDFNTSDLALKGEYLSKIQSNPGITFGRVVRDELVNKILPETDIFVLPTYIETFGFAILEAMAFGIPVIVTNHFAIPEMVENEVNGFLIDTSQHDCEELFRGYVVNSIPADFQQHVTQGLFKYLCILIESFELRKKLGLAGLELARTKFSFERRNSIMLDIYREAVRD